MTEYVLTEEGEFFMQLVLAHGMTAPQGRSTDHLLSEKDVVDRAIMLTLEAFRSMKDHQWLTPYKPPRLEDLEKP